MTIDFHHENNRFTYTARAVQADWAGAVTAVADFAGARVADIGCGGGIYSRACIELGAGRVTGVDFSAEMLIGAEQSCRDMPAIDFRQGDALNTGLGSGLFNIVLERALIHHLPAERLAGCFAEAFRLLAPGGVLIVQDRTPEDCLLPGSRDHVRGYFFEKFPRLGLSETARRHSSDAVLEALRASGFEQAQSAILWETRKVYADGGLLREDLMNRTGRSLLHELNDDELSRLCDYIQEKAGWKSGEGIAERDRWTIWSAQKR